MREKCRRYAALRWRGARIPWPCAQARYDHGYSCVAANAAEKKRCRRDLRPAAEERLSDDGGASPQVAASASEHGGGADGCGGGDYLGECGGAMGRCSSLWLAI